MPKKPLNPKDIYELMENDQGEIMLLLYAGESAPQKAAFRLNEKQRCLELYRNADDTVIIDGLENDSIAKLKQTETLYVCEIKYNEDAESENEILYAYPTAPVKEPPHAQPKQQKQEETSLSEKAREVREKILKKA